MAIFVAKIQPNSLKCTSNLLAHPSRSTEFNGAWQVIRALTLERLRSLKRIATIESVASSTRIEGSKLTNDQVRKLLANLKVQRFATRDNQEVAGYAEVMESILASWQHIGFTEKINCQMYDGLIL